MTTPMNEKNVRLLKAWLKPASLMRRTLTCIEDDTDCLTCVFTDENHHCIFNCIDKVLNNLKK